MPHQQNAPHDSLFGATSLGGVDLINRVALAPMTRVSATAEGVPTDQIAAYYRVFAEGGFGLLITEGLYIDDQTSQGYFFQPGIARPAQAAAWQRVVEGVHASGAKFFAQLMHAGSQSQGNPHTSTTWGPSAVRPRGEQLAMYRGSGSFQMPEAMTAEQIEQVRTAFVSAARFARDAGFDGVEIHGANGYLLDAFLTDYMNTRTDEYGGSVANRVRLATEVCADVAAAVGADIAVGVRISQGKSQTTIIDGQGVRLMRQPYSPRSATPASTIYTLPNIGPWQRLSMAVTRPWRSWPNTTAGCRSSPTAT